MSRVSRLCATVLAFALLLAGGLSACTPAHVAPGDASCKAALVAVDAATDQLHRDLDQAVAPADRSADLGRLEAGSYRARAACGPAESGPPSPERQRSLQRARQPKAG